MQTTYINEICFLEFLYQDLKESKNLNPFTLYHCQHDHISNIRERRRYKKHHGWHWIWCYIKKSNVLVSGFNYLSKYIYIWRRCYDLVSKFQFHLQSLGERASKQANMNCITQSPSINCSVWRSKKKKKAEQNILMTLVRVVDKKGAKSPLLPEIERQSCLRCA